MNQLPRYSSAFLVFLLTAFPVVACADVESGRRAANHGDFKRAYAEWKPLAEAGNPEAQYNLGRLYANGDGVTRSYTQAYRWFEAAALHGSRNARMAISRMYRYGDGVPKDSRQSELWRTGKAVQEKLRERAHSVPQRTPAVFVPAAPTPAATPKIEAAKREEAAPTAAPESEKAQTEETPTDADKEALLKELLGTNSKGEPVPQVSGELAPAASRVPESEDAFRR